MTQSQPSLVVCSLLLISQTANAAAPQTETAAEATNASETRHASLRRGSTLDGSTGLLRLRSADASAVGELRLQVTADGYLPTVAELDLKARERSALHQPAARAISRGRDQDGAQAQTSGQ